MLVFAESENINHLPQECSFSALEIIFKNEFDLLYSLMREIQTLDVELFGHSS